MNRNFEELKSKVEELLQMEECREQLEKERAELRVEAKEFFASVKGKYQEEEEKVLQLMKEAEEEHKNNERKLFALTREKFKAEMQGTGFEDSRKLGELTAINAAYPVKLEALEQLKKEVAVPATDQLKINEYKHKGYLLGEQICGLGKSIHTVLDEILNKNALNCRVSIDTYITERQISHYIGDVFASLENMQKEDLDEYIKTTDENKEKAKEELKGVKA